ncbi:MAG TPA: hypothetical protein VHK69_00780 [Chitinophagaceae bacterium]|jgi:hypothetical protein|nr:hypothetical protein [Chitinophagaceae bacterium]
MARNNAGDKTKMKGLEPSEGSGRAGAPQDPREQQAEPEEGSVRQVHDQGGREEFGDEYETAQDDEMAENEARTESENQTT